MRRYLAAASLALLALATPALSAQPAMAQAAALTAPPPPATTALPYLRAAASGDQFEIQSSQLALRLSRDPQVRRMAQMLITDHRRLTAETTQTARRARIIPPPPRLLPHHAALLRDLRQTRRGQFEAAFHAAQLTAHQEALALHRTYATQGDVRALQASAGRAVPVVERHLSRVQAHRH